MFFTIMLAFLAFAAFIAALFVKS